MCSREVHVHQLHAVWKSGHPVACLLRLRTAIIDAYCRTVTFAHVIYKGTDLLWELHAVTHHSMPAVPDILVYTRREMPTPMKVARK